MRTRAERKHNTWKKILKKLNIINAIGIGNKEITDQPHRLAKDKVEKRSSQQHTNNKTKRHVSGNYQKSKNYAPKDQRQLDKMEVEE